MIVFETVFIWTLLFLKKITLFITFKVTPENKIRELPIGESLTGLSARREEWLPLWGRKQDGGQREVAEEKKGPWVRRWEPQLLVYSPLILSSVDY